MQFLTSASKTFSQLCCQECIFLVEHLWAGVDISSPTALSFATPTSATQALGKKKRKKAILVKGFSSSLWGGRWGVGETIEYRLKTTRLVSRRGILSMFQIFTILLIWNTIRSPWQPLIPHPSCCLITLFEWQRLQRGMKKKKKKG